MSLFACMCNQPQRLIEALGPVRGSLVAAGPVARWGMGYVHGGEVLLSRTPRSAANEGDAPLDFFPALEPVKSDCIIGHAATGAGAELMALPAEATQPFRFRRWMLAQDDGAPVEPEVWQQLSERIPDFLRRNLRGRTAAEITLHLLAAMLHDQASLDDVNVSSAVARRALADTFALFTSTITRAGVTLGKRPGTVVVSNTRALWFARPEHGSPVFMRRLHCLDDRGHRDDSFRGLLVTSGLPVGDGAEEVPAGSVLTVSRDLRVDISPLG